MRGWAGRFVLVPLAVAMGVSASLGAQTALGSLLDDLSRYLGAAARLTLLVIARVDDVQAGQIPASDRPQVVAELERVSREISLLRAAQSPLVFDIAEYVARVRGGAPDAAQRE